MTHALGRKHYVEFAPTPGALPLVVGAVALPILADSQAFPGVLRAARDLQKDIYRVTLREPVVISDGPARSRYVVIVGTLGRNRRIDELVSSGKLEVASIKGR